MRKLLFLFLSFLLAFSIIFVQTSCSEESKTELSVNPDNSLSLKKKKLRRFVTIENYLDSVTIDTSSLPIQTRGMECGYHQVEGWVVDHFEKKSGKNLGVWPHSSRITPSGLAELRNDYHFNYYLHTNGENYNQFEMAHTAGFSKNKIMISCEINGYQYYRVNQYKDQDVYGYYIGEPWTKQYSLYDIVDFIEYVSDSTGEKFVTDEWKMSEPFEVYGDLADIVLCSGYDDSDQVGVWQNFKYYFGVKFSQTWMSEYKDRYQFYELFEKAKSLGLNPVWLYQLDGTSSSSMSNFANNAFYHGYLRRFSRRAVIEYKCFNEANPCDCPPYNENPDMYYLNRTIPYGPIIEDFPATN